MKKADGVKKEKYFRLTDKYTVFIEVGITDGCFNVVRLSTAAASQSPMFSFWVISGVNHWTERKTRH